MRLADTRPPFAGLANLSWEALASLPTPCYLLDEGQLRRNGELLLGVQQRTGCKILLAQKAFSNFNVYPVLAPYLAGTEASGLYESRLGKEELPEKREPCVLRGLPGRRVRGAAAVRRPHRVQFAQPAGKVWPGSKGGGQERGPAAEPGVLHAGRPCNLRPLAPRASRLGTTRAHGDAAVQADRPCPNYWTDCTSTPCASRMPMHWP